MSFGNTVRAIFTKDLLCELRSKRALLAMISLGLLLAWVFRIATQAGQGDGSVIAAAVVLTTILFSVVLSSERIFAAESENDCISGLLLSPADAGDIYIGKLLVNIVMLFIFEAAVVPVVIVLFDVTVAGRLFELIWVLAIADVGMCAAGTLLGSIVRAGRAANSLLSVLVMTALCPMMVPLVYLLGLLFGSAAATSPGSLYVVTGGFGRAVGFMIAFDAIFVTVGWLLFGYTLGE